MIEIIPKPAARLPSSQNILFYFSAVLILMVILSYFILDFYLIGEAERELKRLEELAKVKTEEEIKLEKELSDYEKKIKDFSILIDQHVFSSVTFEFIEKNTHPKVWFSKLGLGPREGGVDLSGETENFVTLHQQAQILKNNSLVRNINLDKIAIGEEGRINFNLSLILDPGLFK